MTWLQGFLLAIVLAFAPAAQAQTIETFSSPAAESGRVLKATGGNLFSFSVTNGATAGYVMVINAAAVPANGAVTPVICLQLPANTSVGVQWDARNPLSLNTGIVLVYSTTGCFTKTASATAFFAGQIQ